MVDYTALTGSLDLFELMVNYVAGGILLSLIIWALVIIVTCIMGRVSMQSIIILLATYFAVASIGYVGALGAVPIALWAMWYGVSGILNFINST